MSQALEIPQSLDEQLKGVLAMDWESYATLSEEEQKRAFPGVVEKVKEYIGSAVSYIKRLNGVEPKQPIEDGRIIEAYHRIWHGMEALFKIADTDDSLLGKYSRLKRALISYYNLLNENPSCVVEGFWMTGEEIEKIKNEIKGRDPSKFKTVDEELFKLMEKHIPNDVRE